MRTGERTFVLLAECLKLDSKMPACKSLHVSAGAGKFRISSACRWALVCGV